VLARAAREVDSAVRKPPTRPAVRTKFQVVALLMREERARVQADTDASASRRAKQLKDLDAVATLLARVAARDTSLLALLAEDARVSDAARSLKATMLRSAGMEAPEEPEPEEPPAPAPGAERQVVPQSVIARRLANPFLPPDFEAAAQRVVAKPRRLAGWELLEPLFRSFEVAGPAPRPACRCPSRARCRSPEAAS